MKFFKGGFIIGFLFRFITELISVIYKIICLLNLQLALLVMLLGFIIFVIAGVEMRGVVFIIFVIALFLSTLYAVFGTVKNILGFNEKENKKRGAQIVQAQPSSIEQAPSDLGGDEQAQPMADYQVETPVYFRAKQNPDYIFAEYSDRYELFQVSNGQLIKIRTDYK